jgi:hypothetical protein
MKRRNYAQMKAVAMREGAQDAASAAVGALAQGATMIPELNKSIDITKLDQGTKAATQATSQAAQSSLLPKGYNFGYYTNPKQPSLADQYGLDYQFNAPRTPFTLP